MCACVFARMLVAWNVTSRLPGCFCVRMRVFCVCVFYLAGTVSGAKAKVSSISTKDRRTVTCLCVCVCVCARARARGRARGVCVCVCTRACMCCVYAHEPMIVERPFLGGLRHLVRRHFGGDCGSI